MAQDTPCYLLNEPVQVWSESAKTWLNGAVAEISAEGEIGSSGAVKVVYLVDNVGTKEKWILPSGVGDSLRKSDGSVNFSKGESLQMWSVAQSTWVDAQICDTLTGSITMVYHSSVGMVQKDIPESMWSSQLKVAEPHYAEGDEVQVWSTAENKWQDALVKELASSDALNKMNASTALDSPPRLKPGSPKVVYDTAQGATETWVPLEQCILKLRRAPTVELAHAPAENADGATENDTTTCPGQVVATPTPKQSQGDGERPRKDDGCSAKKDKGEGCEAPSCVVC